MLLQAATGFDWPGELISAAILGTIVFLFVTGRIIPGGTYDSEVNDRKALQKVVSEEAIPTLSRVLSYLDSDSQSDQELRTEVEALRKDLAEIKDLLL